MTDTASTATDKPANPLDEAGTQPNLDGFYGKEPDELTDDEIDQLIAAHRAQRDAYEKAEAEKEDKAAQRAAKKAEREAKKAAKERGEVVPKKPRAKKAKAEEPALPLAEPSEENEDHVDND